jgi:hypothetical protein
MDRRLLLLTILVTGVVAWCQTPSAADGTPAKKKVSPLAEYVGLWTARFDGRLWLQFRLELNGEQLTGSLVHPRDINLDGEGQLKSVSEEQATEIVTDAALNPDGLVVTVKDPDTQEADRYLMRLVMPAKDAADVKMIGEAMPPGMAKPKPWRVVKSGIAITNTVPVPPQ